MACRCPERGAAIRRAAKAIAGGGFDEVKTESAFVMTTLAEDAQNVARQVKHAAATRLNAARARLMR